MNLRSATKVVGVNILLLLLILFLGELITRITVKYNPGYYTFIETKNRCYLYPYGEICLNSEGFADNEFELSSNKKRIAYVGDSVCFGVGVGDDERISDVLEGYYIEYEHFNFCGVGLGISNRDVDRVIGLANRYELTALVYLANLNDIAPTVVDITPTEETTDVLRKARRSQFIVLLDELRGTSYLYTYLRTLIKNYFVVRGYGASGFRSVELFPQENRRVIVEYAAAVAAFAEVLDGIGVKLIVVLLPYEMQISERAMTRYYEHGVRWEKGFETGSTQELIESELMEVASAGNLFLINAMEAFLPYRKNVEVGELFIYNKGDKLDWNHPSKRGHLIIANYLWELDIFKFMSD